jgi:hypothetical protein
MAIVSPMAPNNVLDIAMLAKSYSELLQQYRGVIQSQRCVEGR